MEEWKDIPGYEKIYQASNTGNVRSYDRVTNNRWNKNNVVKKGKILKSGFNKRGGGIGSTNE